MFCHKCGKKLVEGSVFCNGCGAKVAEQGEPEQAAANVRAFVPLNESVPESDIPPSVRVLQFLRGIPFGLIFFAFLLPLFSVSCSGVSSTSFSTYDFLTLSNNPDVMGSFVRENIGNVHVLSIIAALLVSLTVMAFACSFASGSAGALFGIFGLLDLLIMAGFVYNKIKIPLVTVGYESGFFITIALFLAGIIMGFVSPRNAKSVPSGLIIGLAFVGAVAPFVWTISSF